MRALVIFCLLCITASTALAADLINLDKKAYTFKAQDGGLISTNKIRANSSIYGLCTPGNSCKITLKGRTVSFTSNSKLQIQGGKISLR